VATAKKVKKAKKVVKKSKAAPPAPLVDKDTVYRAMRALVPDLEGQISRLEERLARLENSVNLAPRPRTATPGRSKGEVDD